MKQLEVGVVRHPGARNFYISRVPEGFIALWGRCPHLGCSVSWREDHPVERGDQGFAERGRFFCFCHDAVFNRYGQVTRGPAPRPMDRFPLSVVDGRVIVDTNPTMAIVRQQAGPLDALPLF